MALLRPDRCPRGHPLGPNQYSLSWDLELKAHWLLCGGCVRRSRILRIEGAHWEVYEAGQWVPFEG